MLVGNAPVVEGMTRLKSNIDTGIFRPLQIAAARALELPQSWLDARNTIYQRRRDALVAACRALGMQVEVPQAGLHLLPPIPAGQASTDLAPDLLGRTGLAGTPCTN